MSGEEELRGLSIEFFEEVSENVLQNLCSDFLSLFGKHFRCCFKVC